MDIVKELNALTEELKAMKKEANLPPHTGRYPWEKNKQLPGFKDVPGTIGTVNNEETDWIKEN